MKLSELGLKSKPQTKYFEGGYVAFSTVEGELYYQIFATGKAYQGKIEEGKVISKEHYNLIMSFKKPIDVVKRW